MIPRKLNLTPLLITTFKETLLEDFALGLGTGDCDARLIRPRLSAILMALLAKVMKETCISGVDDEDPATESASNSERPSVDYSTPCWIVDQKLILPPVTDFVTDPVEISMHFILLYGCRPNLDTNVIVLRKQTIVPDEGWGVLAAMCKLISTPSSFIGLMDIDFGRPAAIHRQRKEAGDNGDIYGIHTDTYTWNFFHLNDSGKVRIPSTFCLLFFLISFFCLTEANVYNIVFNQIGFVLVLGPKGGHRSRLPYNKRSCNSLPRSRR